MHACNKKIIWHDKINGKIRLKTHANLQKICFLKALLAFMKTLEKIMLLSNRDNIS